MAKIRYKIIADFLLALHILWIVLLAGGIVFMYYHRWYAPAHLVIISTTLLAGLLWGGCPLTIWERKLRKALDPDTYFDSKSFIATYLKKAFNINITSHQVSWVIAVIKVTSYITSVLILTKKV